MARSYEKIEFASEGATLRGRLYRPSNVSADVPVVIMAHGFSVLAAWLDDFATDFAQAGFAVLVFDHRNFGESDGTPRYGFDNLLHRDSRESATKCRTHISACHHFHQSYGGQTPVRQNPLERSQSQSRLTRQLRPKTRGP